MSDATFEPLAVARVTRVGDLVVNVEATTQDWLDSNESDPWFYFVVAPDRDGRFPVIGLRYEPSAGLFEQPEVSEDAE